MVDIVKKYFSYLFKSKGVGNMDSVLFGVRRCVIVEMNDFLLSPYSKIEVFEAVKSMGPTKATGNDGFFSILYQQY